MKPAPRRRKLLMKEKKADTGVQGHIAEQCRRGRAERMLARMRHDTGD